MQTYYLAVDIGASSGRHILGTLNAGKIELEEIYRFENGMKSYRGRLTWDIEHLAREVVAGIKKAGELGKIPKYMAIDTWGVDYALVDKCGEVVDCVFGYRDERGARGRELVHKVIGESELYGRGGIQQLDYNTVYQLMADKAERPEALARADKLLMIPDYLGFYLTGKSEMEYTNATTGAIVSLKTGEIDNELLAMLGIPTKLFTDKLKMPGEVLGNLKPEIQREVGFDLTVLHAPSHDTASAVLATPTNSGGAVYLSSGTWSLLGIEIKEPIATDAAREMSFTHEGGYDHRYRFLTNIMGLWIIQSIRREYENKYSFIELSDMARAAGKPPVMINVNDKSLLAPSSMLSALRNLMGAEYSLPEVLACVYHSLARYYAVSVGELSRLAGFNPTALYIIGGGSRDEYLNELTRAYLDLPVYAGPTEATSIGNILSQMLASGEVGSLAEGRTLVFNSFNVLKV